MSAGSLKTKPYLAEYARSTSNQRDECDGELVSESCALIHKHCVRAAGLLQVPAIEVTLPFLGYRNVNDLIANSNRWPMALWHMQVHLIPSNAAPPARLRDGLDTSDSWKETDEPDWNMIATHSQLQKVKGWLPDVWVWGDPDNLQLYVVREEGRTVDAFLRIDVRQGDHASLDELLKQLKNASLDLVFSESDICTPSLEAVQERMPSSGKWQVIDGQRDDEGKLPAN